MDYIKGVSEIFSSELGGEIAQLGERLCAEVGRCVLIYQEIEKTLKQLLPVATIEGSIRDSRFVRAKGAPNVEFQTLGILVGALKSQVLKMDAPEDGKSKAEFSSRFWVLLTPEAWQTCCDALDALVDERNKMVHHFYDKGFNWTSANDIRSAIEATTGALGRAREQRAFVAGLEKSLGSAIADHAAFMDSAEFGSIFELVWLRESATVKVLQSALAESRDPEGWFPIATAGHRVHADPVAAEELNNARERFGLKSLSDFVRASGLFEMGEQAAGNGTRTVYRLAPFVEVHAPLAVPAKNA